MLACLFRKLQYVLVVIPVILVVLVITVIPSFQSFQLSGHYSFVTVTVIAAFRSWVQSRHSRSNQYTIHITGAVTIGMKNIAYSLGHQLCFTKWRRKCLFIMAALCQTPGIICNGLLYLTETFAASWKFRKSAPNDHYSLQRACIPD